MSHVLRHETGILRLELRCGRGTGVGGPWFQCGSNLTGPRLTQPKKSLVNSGRIGPCRTPSGQLITRRSQVRILPPLLRKPPLARGLSCLTGRFIRSPWFQSHVTVRAAASHHAPVPGSKEREQTAHASGRRSRRCFIEIAFASSSDLLLRCQGLALSHIPGRETDCT
jgi:hypothetical protein